VNPAAARPANQNRSPNTTIEVKRFCSQPSLVAAALAVICALAGNVAAEPPADAASEAYREGDYAKAAERFRAALAAKETPALRHNLALALFQQGRPAKALWQLERALLLDPLNAGYRAKRAALRERLQRPDRGARPLAMAAQILPLDAWVWVATGAFWFLAAALAIPVARGRKPPRWLRALRWVAPVILVGAAAAAFAQKSLRERGIVVSEQPVELKAAPATAAPSSGQADPGELARVRGGHQNYLRVKTETGATGWIGREAFRPLMDRDP